MKRHYAMLSGSSFVPLCRRWTYSPGDFRRWDKTTVRALVTCQHCRKSKLFFRPQLSIK